MRSYLDEHLRSIYCATYRNRKLSPIRFLYTSIVRLRYWLWGKKAKGIDAALGIPVVVVGNLTMGGAGKTPVVIALVEWLQSRGLGVAVIGRGYGAKVSIKTPRVVHENSTAIEVGDEPLLIYQKTGVLVVVCPNRRLAALQVKKENPKIDIIISDDGLQHYALMRAIEVVVVDSWRGFGNGLCLPEGPLREPLTRLKTVDFVFDATHLKAEALYIYNIWQPAERLTWSEFRQKIAGRLVHAIAGIANPEKFFRTLEVEHLSFARHPFPDHYHFTLEDFSFLHPNDVLLMTEKDKVKCLPLLQEKYQLKEPHQFQEQLQSLPELWCVELQVQIQTTLLDRMMILLSHYQID